MNRVWFQQALIAVLVMAWFAPTQAEVFKWVDEDGNVHFGDRVPSTHRDEADAVQLSDSGPSQAEVEARRQQVERIRNAAFATAESNAARASENERSPDQSGTQQPNSSTPPPLPIRPTTQQKRERYEREMARYHRSMDCFAPYRNVNGSIKAEAFDKCEVVKRPKWPD